MKEYLENFERIVREQRLSDSKCRRRIQSVGADIQFFQRGILSDALSQYVSTLRSKTVHLEIAFLQTHVFLHECKSTSLACHTRRHTLIPLAMSIALRPRMLFQLRSIASNVSFPPDSVEHKNVSHSALPSRTSLTDECAKNFATFFTETIVT